jgi:hypothetical protein
MSDMDDVFVELCRSATLGPLRLGMTTPEVQKRIGKPDDIDWIDGASNWELQRHSYPGVSLTLTRPEGDLLRLSRISIEFRGLGLLTLPKPIAQGVAQSARSLSMDEARRVLADHGIEMAYRSGYLLRNLDDAFIAIHNAGGLVGSIHADWRRPAATLSAKRPRTDWPR